MRVVFWGTYDTGKPRNRILLKGLMANGVDVIECHTEIWQGVEDKSQVAGWGKRLKIFLLWFLSYPLLIFRYLRLPDHDVVFVGYMGQVDVLFLWFFARLRGVPIVWDAFLSLYDSVVWDRKIVGPKNPLALFLYFVEWLACRASDKVILDTNTHGLYFKDTFKIKPANKVQHVLVGAETNLFAPSFLADAKTRTNQRSFTILFYGQFIPLQGIEFIVEAAKKMEGENYQWIIIGKGQDAAAIEQLCRKLQVNNIRRIEWVAYEQLVAWIRKADVGLGVFGVTDKAQRVIPNKVFQLLAAGCPLITGDTPAARELLSQSEMVRLVPVGDAKALADTIRSMAESRKHRERSHDRNILARITPESIGYELKLIMSDLINKT